MSSYFDVHSKGIVLIDIFCFFRFYMMMSRMMMLMMASMMLMMKMMMMILMTMMMVLMMMTIPMSKYMMSIMMMSTMMMLMMASMMMIMMMMTMRMMVMMMTITMSMMFSHAFARSHKRTLSHAHTNAGRTRHMYHRQMTSRPSPSSFSFVILHKIPRSLE